MEENNLQEIKRPWQGTTWAWITATMAVLLSLLLLILIVSVGSLNTEEFFDLGALGLGVFLITFVIAVPILLSPSRV